MIKKCILLSLALVFSMSSFVFAGKPIKTLTDIEQLGRSLYTDDNLSKFFNQSCKTCHHDYSGFADMSNLSNPDKNFTSLGSDDLSLGGRNAPSAAYSGLSPILHWNDDDELFIGGTFWDGRASGLKITNLGPTATGGLGDGPTGDPIADQAKGPFLNPIEMALDSENTVVARVFGSEYYDQYLAVYPTAADQDVKVAYNNIAEAIAAFERSEMLEKFKSRFDLFVDELDALGFTADQFGIELVELIVEPEPFEFRKFVAPADWLLTNTDGATINDFSLSPAELTGLALFNSDSHTQLGVSEQPELAGARNGGMCYACHLTENHDESQYGELNKAPSKDYKPIFTDFSYDNLGVPINRTLDAYLMAVDPTKQGHVYDYGLGAQIEILQAVNLAAVVVVELPLNDWTDATIEVARDDAGKVKVPTLRNIAMTSPYAHNGFFSTLEHIVRFYNRRDILPVCTGAAGDIDGFNCYSEAEIPYNVNGSELGNLGLSDADENLIVDFMKSLTDE